MGGLCADRVRGSVVLLWRSWIPVSSRDALEALACLLGQAGAGRAGCQLPEQLTGRGRREMFQHLDGTDGTQFLALGRCSSMSTSGDCERHLVQLPSGRRVAYADEARLSI